MTGYKIDGSTTHASLQLAKKLGCANIYIKTAKSSLELGATECTWFV